MDFELSYTEAQERFREEVRNWLEEHVPASMKLLGGRVDAAVEQDAILLRKKLADEGWLASTREQAPILLEEMRRYGLDWLIKDNLVGLDVALDTLGSDEQKKDLRPALGRGSAIIWRQVREPNSFLDPSAIGVDARKDGDDYILNGQDTFVGSGERPHFLWTLAVMDRTAPAHTALAAFLVPSGLDGIGFQRIDALTPRRAHKVLFDEVSVPAKYLVGSDADGWGIADAVDRADPFPDVPYDGEKHVAHLIEWSKRMTRDGVRITEEPYYAQILVEVYLDTLIIRLMRQRNQWMAASGKGLTYEQAQLALREKQAAVKFSRVARDIMGPYAQLSAEDPLSPFNGEFDTQQKIGLAQQNPNPGPEVQAGAIARALGLGKKKDDDRSPPSPAPQRSGPTESGFNLGWDLLDDEDEEAADVTPGR